MQLTPSQIETLRKQPQSTKLYLSIFQPTAVFKALVNNASAAKGDRVITYDTVSLGVFGQIKDGMTMWVGTTAGGMELGKIRVRSATNTTITVSENSNVNWQDNAYLTVFQYWELWPVYPRIIADPNKVGNTIWFKDYDIAYTNQNSILGTFINAGPHRAINLDPASNTGQIYYTSTGTYSLLGNSLNYNWFFEGATVTGSSSATPGYITYNTPGQYVTRLTVSGSSGETDTTYRYVSVYNNANPPIAKWTLESLQGSRDEGGYNASIKVFQIIPIQEHAVVVLYGDSTYGDTSTNLGGNAENNSNIFFVGYVDKDSIQYDYQHSEVTFDAVSITAMMKKSSGFSVSVASKASPAYWYELLDMDSRRALFHYLRWHTTALNISDFRFLGQDYPIQFYDSDRGSMYDALDNYMKNTMIGNVVSDRQSRIWAEVDAMAYPNPTGTFTPIMDITNRDWMNSPRVDEQLTNSVSYIEYGGVAYSGVGTGTFNAYIGSAPGDAPGFYGTVDGKEGLALQSQSQLNTLIGNVFANKNAPFPTINIDASINATNLDIAPQETLGLHILPSDTVRNVTIDGLYIPNSMTWRYDPEGFKMLPNVELKQLVNGFAGQTITIPSVNDVGEGLGFDPFSLNFPPLPLVFPPTGLGVGNGAPSTVIVHLAERLGIKYGLAYTTNFNSPFPNWIQWNTGLTPDQYNNIDLLYVCPNGSVYVACTASTPSSFGFLARAPGVGQSFSILEDSTTMVAKMSSSDNVRLCAIGVNPLSSEQVVYAISQASENFRLYIGANGSYAAGLVSGGAFTNNGSSLSFGGGVWRWTSGNCLVLNAGASAITAARSNPGFIATAQRHIGVGSSAFSINWGNTDIALGSNNFSSYVGPFTPPLATIAYLQQNIIACSLTGRYVMALGGSLTVRSTDYGYSWSTGYPSPVAAKVDASQTLEGGFVIAGGVTVQWTDDGGSTWNNKIGDLTTIDPFGVCDAVRIVQ